MHIITKFTFKKKVKKSVKYWRAPQKN